MGLRLGKVQKQNPQDAIVTRGNGHVDPATTGLPVFDDDLLETRAVGASVIVEDPTFVPAATAAVVYGAYSYFNVYYPPATATHIYYNNSYRYKLHSPGGYVGIRG